MQQLERLDDMARPKKMALIHVNRLLRKDKENILKKYKKRRWIMPEAGDVINLQMHKLVHIVRFESARRLTKVPKDHPCSNLYGLAFKLEIHVDGYVNTDTGFVIYFSEIEKYFEPLKEKLENANESV